MAGRTRPLVMVIDGDVSGLKTAARAAQNVSAEIAEAVKKGEGEVQASAAMYTAAFDKIAASSEVAMNKAAKAISDDINRMVREAERASRIGEEFNPAGGMSSASQQLYADNSRKLSAELLRQAEAYDKVAAAGGPLANQMQAAAREAQLNAMALKQEADAAELVADELKKVEIAHGDVRESASGLVATGQKVTASSGTMKQGMQQLSYQVSDVATQFASGTPPMQIFAQQGGQVVQSLSMMSEGSKGLLGILGNPWFNIVFAAGTVIATLAANLLSSKDAAEDAGSAHETFAEKIDLQKHSLDEVIAALREYNKEQERSRELTLDGAKAVALKAAEDLKAAIAIREKLKASLEEYQAAARAPTGPGGQGQIGAAAGASALAVDVKKQDTYIAELQKALGNANADLAEEMAKLASDPKYAIEQRFEKMRNDARATIKDVDALAARLGQISKDEADELEKQKPARSTRTAGESLSRSQSASLLATAQGYIGLREGRDRAQLANILAEGGKSVDPKITAWCAAFVNAVLATNGLPGTGQLNARSFLDYGSRADRPEKGDIVVLRRGKDPAQGHVGFYAGEGKNGTVLVTGGNQGDKVSTAAFKRSDVLGYRRAPTGDQIAAEQAKAEEKATRDLEAVEIALLASKQEAARLASEGVTDLAKIARLEKEEVDAELTRKLAQNAKLDADHEAVDLQDKANAATKKAAIDAKLAQDLKLEALEAEGRRLDDAHELLAIEGAIAPTLAERRDIAFQLLELERKIALNKIDEQLATKQISEEEAARARDIVNARSDAGKEQVEKGAFGQYKERLEKNVGDMDQALEGVAVHGLESLEQGLLGLIDGTEDVSSAFKKMAAAIIADLARIAIQKAILSIFAFATGDVPAHATGHIPGFANGIIHGPGDGTSDSILAWHEGMGLIRVSNGESIITAEGTRKHRGLLKAINDGSLPAFASGMVPTVNYPRIPGSDDLRAASAPPAQYFDLRGAVVTEQLYRDMHAIGAHHAANALAAAPALTREEMGEASWGQIPT